MPKKLYALFGLGLAACHTPPPPAFPQDPELPATWEASAEAPAAASLAVDWWTSFADSQLNQIINQALANNRDLAAASARMQAFAAQVQVVGGQLWPQAQGGLDLSRGRQNFIGLPIPGAPEVLPITSNRFQLGLNLSWEIDLWGRVQAQKEAATANWEGKQAEFAAAQLSLIGQTTKAWFALAEVEQQTQLLQQQVANAKDLAAYQALRFTHGGDAASVQQARQQLHALESSLPLRLHQQALWQQNIRTLLASPQDALPAPSAELPALPEPVAVGLPAQLLSRRPDLAQAEAAVKAARANSKAATASLYPSISLTGSNGTSSTALGDLLDGNFQVWNLGANLSAPLFQGGSLQAQADSADFLTQAAELQFAQTMLRAFAEVQTLLDNEERLQESLQALAQQLQSQQAELELWQNRYQAGTADAAQLYAARAKLLQLQSQKINTHLLLLNNRIDLYLALGGGFQSTHSS